MSINAHSIEPPKPTERREVKIGVLEAELCLPTRAPGLVLFAHGSGSSRHSPRNQAVAGVLQDAGIATLLFDLFTPDEEESDAITGDLRFDIPFLADRLIDATRWAVKETQLERLGLGLGYFGASTGGAAALVAAAKLSSLVDAVVSRGGRPDLAMDSLARVKAPTLLIVGARDEVVLQLNEEAHDQLRCEKQMAIIPRATHLFEEPGALDQVARLASTWFLRHFQN